ncbi:MAG: hypothetical protein QM599_01845 [Pseudoxanthomonas sp.]
MPTKRPSKELRDHPFILGGRVHSRLVAMEGLVALMRNANGVAFSACNPTEREAVFCAFDVLLRDAKHTIGAMNELAGSPAMDGDESK